MKRTPIRTAFLFVLASAAGIAGTSLSAPAQMTPFTMDDPCAMFRQPGAPRLCLPVKIYVTDSRVDTANETYCDPPGVLPCNKKKYIKSSIAFEYEAEASGFMLYSKNFEEFNVAVQGTPLKTRIKRIEGFRQWFTQKGGRGGRAWHKKNFPHGSVTVRNPIGLSINYPAGEGSKWNVGFDSLEIGSNDDEMPTHDGSDLGSEAAGQGPRPWMILPQEMRRIVDAGGFTKTFHWRESQPDGESFTDYRLTIRAEIGEPCKEKIGLSIRTGDGRDKYCFSEGSPGKLEFTLTAEVTPPAYADEVTWTLPDLPGSTRAVSPADAKGRTIKVTYTNLPKRNADFGPKTVTASIVHGSCRAQDQIEIQFFFPKMAKNNPGGTDPNWFYYWSQTSARVGPARFGGGLSKCVVDPNARNLGYYRSEIFDTVYYICDLRALGPDFPFLAKRIVGNKWGEAKVTGIDTFAVACLHENAHYEHFTQWWKAHRTSDRFEDTNRNGIKDDRERKFDKDGDLVPDALEEGLHLDPKNGNTYGIGPDGDDEEALCWFAETTWKIGKADKEDWAKPGKQWK